MKGKELFEVAVSDFDRSAPNGGSHYEVIKPFELWIQMGYEPTNAYFGNARISRPKYEKDKANVGDIIQHLPGGIFLVRKNQKKLIPVKLTPPSTKGPFERNYGFTSIITKEIADSLKRINKTV